MKRKVNHHRKFWKLLPVVRAIGVLSAVGVITTMATFAAIQSKGNALTGNTIQTATAALQISTSGTADSFADNVAGFDFVGLMPNNVAQPAANNYTVYLRNTGDTSLKLSLAVPVLPTVSDTMDLTKVFVLLTPPAQPGYQPPAQSFALSKLIAGTMELTGPGDTLGVDATVRFQVQVAMAPGAVNGSGGSITDLDLSFSGVPQ